ncbi:MAG: hypothetical protein WCR30_03610 [Clostridia bacterium]
MITTRKNSSIRSYACILLAFLFFIAFASLNFSKKLNVYAEFEEVSISNGNFTASSNVSLVSPSSWTSVNTVPSYARAGVIDVSSSAYQSYGTTTSDSSSSYYMLSTQPTKMNEAFDNKILMINARSNSYSIGYKSSDISLSADSQYIITILARAEENATFSMFIDGIDEEDLLPNIDTTCQIVDSDTNWKEYKFYITTANQAQSINVQLWLGTRLGTTSKNAVFFDNIKIKKVSNQFFETDLINNYAGSNNYEINLVDSKNFFTPFGYENSDFETAQNSFTYSEDSDNANGIGNYVSIKTLSSQISGEIFGTDLKNGNTKGLALHAESSSAIGVQGESFFIPMGSIIKVSANLKVSDEMVGNAYLRFVEIGTDELIEAFPSYELEKTKSSQISTNSTNVCTNDYTKVSFLIKSNPLYDTTAKIEFWIGESSTKAVGTAVFDNLTFEYIPFEDYDSKNTNDIQIDLSPISGTPSVTNGTFNIFENETVEANFYPVKPASFTRTYDESLIGADENLVYGVVNTNESKFNVESVPNPGGLQGQNTDYRTETNNVFMIQNKIVSYQTFKSSTFTLSANTITEITFQLNASGNVYASVVNSNDVVLASLKNIYSPNEFREFKFVVKTGSEAQTVSISFGLGTSSNPASGVAFFDNFAQSTTTLTDDEFTTLTSSQDLYLKVVDIKNKFFSKGDVLTNDTAIYSPAFLAGSLTNGTSLGAEIAYGGIIDGSNPLFDIPSSFTNTNQSVLLIKNNGSATYQFVGNISETLSASKYYRISIWVKTALSNPNDLEDCGMSLSINSSSTKFENIFSKDNEYQEFSFIYYGTEEKILTYTFTLASTDNSVYGYALFTQPVIEEITKTTFETEATEIDVESPPVNMLNISLDTATDETNEEETPTNTGSFDFLLIPSLIMALALIVAVVGFTARRIKFKKLQFKQKSSYDRSFTVSETILRKEAEEKQSVEIKKINSDISKINETIKALETEYAESLKQYRDSLGKLSSEDKKISDSKQEKLFKSYSAKHARYENILTSANEKLTEVQSVEYLLSLERKIDKENAKKAKKAKKELKAKQVESIAKQEETK